MIGSSSILVRSKSVRMVRNTYFLTRFFASLPLLARLSGVVSMVTPTAIFFNGGARISGRAGFWGGELFQSNFCIHQLKS